MNKFKDNSINNQQNTYNCIDLIEINILIINTEINNKVSQFFNNVIILSL